jgi:outer membrane protein OmpA-like peptidoglycan-associated protein
VGVQERSFIATTPVSKYAGTGTYYGHSGTLGSTAVQGIVGISMPITNSFAAILDYRVLEKIQSRNVGGVYSYGTQVTGAGANIGPSFEQSVMLGFRYSLNAAPAMAVAAVAPVPAAAPLVINTPAPAPSKSYLVFFDWDSLALNARTQQIIADAAKNAGVVRATRIDVAGHADKSGSAVYNQTISIKRANVVAAELERLGIAKSAISITAFGDTKPMVPTAEGVREPQNRRVEIVLH